MPRKLISFELDFMIKDILPRFTVKQFDDVSFNIKPKNQGLDYDTTGMTGKIFVGVNNDMFMQTTGITVSSNNINVLLDKNMLQNRGRAYAEIELTDSKGTISSSSFIFNIDPKIGEGGQIPGEYEGFVEKYERLISEFKTQVNSTINNCNTQVNSTINNCNASVNNKLNTVDSFVDTKISELENRFNALTSKQQQDAEVIDARDGETSLKARLERDLAKGKEIYSEVEGSHISTDSSSGYLKDVEIKGNTIQDASNLADIKSVGEKVEGQELYEIPVLSCGKNLVSSMDVGGINASGVEVSGTNNRTSYSKVKPNTQYITSRNGVKRNTNIFYFDKNKNIISNASNSGLFTTPSNCFYVRHTFGTTYEDGFMMEEGTVATPYEPYQEDKLTILSPTPLEKVGDVADRIICKDGVWGVEKNIETATFKTSDVIHASQYDLTNTKYYYSNAGLLELPLNINVANQITSYFEIISYSSIPTTDKVGISIGSIGNIRLRISNTTTIEQVISDIVLKYQLATPQFIPLPHDQQVKLRTFANKTNISFLTEIEGTIKAQVPKSIGATVNTHTEQISNLNKELDRVKKLEESTVSTVETESDFTTVEATSNGYFEDVKLEGKTLVNLAKNTRITRSNTVGDFHMGDFGTCFDFPIDANKEYTFIINVLKNTSGVNLTMNDTGAYANFVFPRINSLVNGLNVLKLKVKENVTITQNSYWGTIGLRNSTTIGDIDVEVTILEGDHTQNPPSYFEGLKSVGQGTDEIVVSSVNENLFDGTLSSWWIGSSVVKEENSKKYSTLSMISPNEVYTIKNHTREFNRANYAWLDKDFNTISMHTFTSINECTTKISPNNSKYLLCYVNSIGDLSNNDNIMLNKGTTPKPYAPHQADKKRLLFYNNETQTWEKPVLREWDSIEKHSDGKYYYHQRSGEVVLNGTHSTSTYGNESDTHITFNTHIPNSNGVANGNLICEKFKCASVLTNNDCVWMLTPNNFYIRLNKSLLPTQDVQGFKQWLQANNVTVVYQLAQEKVYECTNIDLITYANETNYIVECGAISPKSTLKVHNNISNVVSLLQKKVSLLESNITSYMITQNRMQLASTYSADSVTFKVDYALCSEEVEYNEDLYNLILNNILVGKDNYDYDKMFTMVLDYASWNQISWEQFDILVGLMDIQHNPPVEEIPTDDEVIEEIPNEIM